MTDHKPLSADPLGPNWSATCDWGNCDNLSICLRLSTEDDAGWVAVCVVHAVGAADDELAPALDAERAATPSASPDREALRVLRAVALGQVNHLYEGFCPDRIDGPDTRDPACIVCQALDALDAPVPDAPGAGLRHRPVCANDDEPWPCGRIKELSPALERVPAVPDAPGAGLREAAQALMDEWDDLRHPDWHTRVGRAVPALRAALAAPVADAPGAGLDVERLTDALDGAEDEVYAAAIDFVAGYVKPSREALRLLIAAILAADTTGTDEP